VAFDEAPFAAVVERVAQSGITFLGFMGRPPEPYLRGFWAVDNATTHDVPGYGDATLPTYERWLADVEPYFPRSYVQFALDGDEVIGISTLEISADGTAANTGMTGVLREYRGRNIALALKLQTIAEAKRLGLKLMRTNNDPDNPPMLAVNRKLGYVFIPGPRRLRKALV
jgi:GNAT superfamily N-acetyltransferase